MKKVKSIIRQLEDLAEHAKEMQKADTDSGVWEKDIEALNFAIESIQTNIFLSDIIIKKEKEYNKILVALFATIRNNSVLEIGLREGKSMAEINKMTIEILTKTVNGKIIDLEKMRESFNEGIELYNKTKRE